MQKFNYHTHTYRCGHAEMISDEDFVKEFISQGFEKIAFTDHCPYKNQVDKSKNMRMDYNEKAGYLNSINSLKQKYSSKIKIESGYEVEYLPDLLDELKEIKNEVDKILLGQHFIYNEDNTSLKNFRRHDFNENDLIKYATYIETALKHNIPDIIVHPDIYMKNRENFGEIEAKVAHIICKAAEKYKVPLEINLTEPCSFLMGKKKTIAYPCKFFWEIASKYDIKVLYGADAHYKNQIIMYDDSIKLVNNIIGEDVIKKLNFYND